MLRVPDDMHGGAALSAGVFFEQIACEMPALASAEIASDVALVERELELMVGSEAPTVTAVGRHILRAGGKRLRPAFVALAARSVGKPYDRDRMILLGACLELIHMATLIHDDVVDNASTRRGLPTAGSAYGNTASVLAGDALLAKAMKLLAEDGDLQIIRAVSSAVVNMAEGEVLEVEARGILTIVPDEYLRILELKTAAFIEGCCLAGGLVAGASQQQLQALATYGRQAGLAFQIVDDILDMRGDDLKTGKPAGRDFREGCATLPLIFLCESLEAPRMAVVRRLFGTGCTTEEFATIAGWIEESGAYERAGAIAEGYARAARSVLTSLPADEPRKMLETATEFILARER